MQSHLAAIHAGRQAKPHRLPLPIVLSSGPAFSLQTDFWIPSQLGGSNVGNIPTMTMLSACQGTRPMLRRLWKFFRTFKLSYERLKSWHMGPRSKIPRTKYEKNMSGIFQDLRPPAKDRLDLLCHTQTFEVASVDLENKQLTVNPEIPKDGYLRWTSKTGILSPSITMPNQLTVEDAQNYGGATSRCSRPVPTHTHTPCIPSLWTFGLQSGMPSLRLSPRLGDV